MRKKGDNDNLVTNLREIRFAEYEKNVSLLCVEFTALKENSHEISD